MTHNVTEELPEVVEARKALTCLYLEVPSEVATDVRRRVEAAFAALRSRPAPSAEEPTSEQLAEWERLAAEATPGPWEPCLGSGTHRCTGVKSETGVMVCDVQPDYFIEQPSQAPPIERRADHQPDIDFISAARTAVPALLAALKARREDK